MGLIKSSLIPFSKLHDIKMFQFARLRIESRAFFVSASQTFNVKKIWKFKSRRIFSTINPYKLEAIISSNYNRNLERDNGRMARFVKNSRFEIPSHRLERA